MIRLVVGDIHGCYSEFSELIEKARKLTNGQLSEIIALGDIVDRGLESRAVLDLFMEATADNGLNYRSLMGNHEYRHVLAHENKTYRSFSQIVTKEQLTSEAYDQALRFMEKLPKWIELDEAILCHGFLEPDVSLSAQNEETLVGTLRAERRLKTKSLWPWFDHYDAEKPVIVGHRDYSEKGVPTVYNDNIFCIDTGSCFGNNLTGLIIPGFKFVSVCSRGNYWEETKQRYYDLRFVSTPDELLTWNHMKGVISAIELRKATPGAKKRAERLKYLLDECDGIIDTVVSHFTSRASHYLAEVQGEVNEKEMSESERARRFNLYLLDLPWKSFLNLARKGMLTRDFIRKKFRNPVRLKAFASSIETFDQAPDRL